MIHNSTTTSYMREVCIIWAVTSNLQYKISIVLTYTAFAHDL